MRYQAKMKAKKEKAVQKLFQKEEISNIPSHSPLKSKHPDVSFTSFVWQRSVLQIFNRQTSYSCCHNEACMATRVQASRKEKIDEQILEVTHKFGTNYA